jgi:protein O-mannosyl-transferase
MHDRFNVMPRIALLLVLLLTILVYWPGLHGGFLFDDFGNLPSLGSNGPINNWPAFWSYITSGTADPTGRPMTLLTFLLDAHNWPADPFPFKRTNLILHLINGVLLYSLLVRLGAVLNVEARRCRTAALLGASLWLLHPLMVSTTLYIVQREAMLPATCALAGLLIWIHGRTLLVQGKIHQGLGLSVFGLGGFTLLGMLAKANGVLLPLYALLIEVVVLAPRQQLSTPGAKRAQRNIMLGMCVIPSVVVACAMCLIAINGVIQGGDATGRPWTYLQRLATEPRVVMDYLSLLWMPRSFTSGVFNDQYIASTSLLHPFTTLPAILAVLALIGVAWSLRYRHPALALAILFYFSGQLIESTSLPLELYFEHRNYVPAMLMFWPLGLWLADMHTLPLVKRILTMALIVGLASMTYVSAKVWGNVESQAYIWAQLNPNSPRAQANLAQIEVQTGHAPDAAQRLQAMLDDRPDQLQLALNLLAARCAMGRVEPHDLAAARTAMLSTSTVGGLITSWFDRTLPVSAAGGCPGLTPADLLDLINAGLQNPRLAAFGPHQDLMFIKGLIVLAQHQPDAALTDFAHALDSNAQPGVALRAAAALGAAGYPAYGLKMLDCYEEVRRKAQPPAVGMPTLHAWVLTHQNYWENEISHLRHELSSDAAPTNTTLTQPDLEWNYAP